MSSHHIVREKQEPALLILNLTGFDPEHLGQLLEWSPTVLAVGAEAERLYAWGIHVDYLLTGDKPDFPIQADVQIINVKNQSLLAAGLHLLIAQGYPAVNLIGSSIREVYPTYADDIILTGYYNNRKSYAVRSGYSKWYPAGTKLFVENSPADLQCNNLNMIGQEILTVQKDGSMTLIFGQEYLIIEEEI